MTVVRVERGKLEEGTRLSGREEGRTGTKGWGGVRTEELFVGVERVSAD